MSWNVWRLWELTLHKYLTNVYLSTGFAIPASALSSTSGDINANLGGSKAFLPPPPPLLPLGFPLITQKLQTWQFAALSNFSLETLLLNLVSLMIPSFQIILGKTQTVVFPICGFLVNPLWLIWSNPEAWSPDSGLPGVWFADTSKIKEVLVRRGYSPDISFSNISCYITGQWGASSE